MQENIVLTHVSVGNISDGFEGYNLKSKGFYFLCVSCYASDKEMHDLYSESCFIDLFPSQSVNNIIALKAVLLKWYLLGIKFADIRPNEKSHSGRGSNALFKETIF